MKKLYVLRHAKSSWSNTALGDFDRPLNQRGDKDAPFMGAKFNELGIKPDKIVSSSATRAITTAFIIAGCIGYDPLKIEARKDLYLTDAGFLLKAINTQSEEINSLMIVGHNPGVTAFVNGLVGMVTENMPTCALVAIEFETDSWKNVYWKTGKLSHFEYPKKY